MADPDAGGHTGRAQHRQVMDTPGDAHRHRPGRGGQEHLDLADAAAELEGVQGEPAEVEAGVGGAAVHPDMPGDRGVQGHMAAWRWAEHGEAGLVVLVEDVH